MVLRYQRTALFEVLETMERDQAWLARKMGVSKSLVSKIKSGERSITEPFARKAATVLGLPVSALFFDPVLSDECMLMPSGNTEAADALVA